MLHGKIARVCCWFLTSDWGFLWGWGVSRVQVVLCLIARGEGLPQKKKEEKKRGRGLDRKVGGSELGVFIFVA